MSRKKKVTFTFDPTWVALAVVFVVSVPMNKWFLDSQLRAQGTQQSFP